MSSILNALNKLQSDDKSELNKFTPDLSLDTEKILSDKLREKKNKKYFILLLIIIALPGLWLAFFNKAEVIQIPEKKNLNIQALENKPSGKKAHAAYSFNEENKIKEKTLQETIEKNILKEDSSDKNPEKIEETAEIQKSVNETPESLAVYPTADPEIFSLQAISWAEEGEASIAVINSELVKEGQKINAAKVKKIKENSVLLEYKGEIVVLKFR